eukprot:Pgem_evm1s3943
MHFPLFLTSALLVTTTTTVTATVYNNLTSYQASQPQVSNNPCPRCPALKSNRAFNIWYVDDTVNAGIQIKAGNGNYINLKFSELASSSYEATTVEIETDSNGRIQYKCLEYLDYNFQKPILEEMDFSQRREVERFSKWFKLSPTTNYKNTMVEARYIGGGSPTLPY